MGKSIQKVNGGQIDSKANPNNCQSKSDDNADSFKQQRSLFSTTATERKVTQKNMRGVYMCKTVTYIVVGCTVFNAIINLMRYLRGSNTDFSPKQHAYNDYMKPYEILIGLAAILTITFFMSCAMYNGYKAIRD